MPIGMPLRIYITGRVAIEHERLLLDQEEFPGRQGVVLFARLVVNRGSAVSREELTNVLWSDAPPKAWDTALNAIVSKLRVLLARAGLKKSDVLPAALGCYQLNIPGAAWVDVETAADSLHSAEGFIKTDRHRDAWAAAQVAYHICRRPFLPGESGPWVDQTRERFATLFVRACECLAETYIRNCEPAIAVDLSTQAIVAQPYRETGYQLLMRAHQASGNRAEALLAYERCRKLLSEELGVFPSAETQVVYQRLLKHR